MSCVTPADLGKPIAAIVERCGPPLGVMSVWTQNQLLYAEGGQGVSVTFDADQMRARIIQFFTMPPDPSQPIANWTVTLPFESGPREIALGQMTLADAQSTLAVDADVTTNTGVAFRSTANNDILLAFDEQRIARQAFVGERASLVQSGMIASQLGDAPLDYLQPVPRDDWLRKPDGTSGARTTIFRIDIDGEGIARKVTIVIPSGDSAFDVSTQQRISDARYRPATLSKRPVSGTIFVQVRH
jgi:hypothetical protein